MPLYEYQCKKCHHRFEKIQKFSDQPIKKCPECGGSVEKLLSPPAVQFKGTGWYVTDYARKSGNSESGASGGTASAATDGAKDGTSAKPSADQGESKKPEKKPTKK